MKHFIPGERFRLPSGQMVLVHIRLIPDAAGDVPVLSEGCTAADYAYEVGLDGGIYAVPLTEFRPGFHKIPPPPESTALTVDDLTPVGKGGDE